MQLRKKKRKESRLYTKFLKLQNQKCSRAPIKNMLGINALEVKPLMLQIQMFLCIVQFAFVVDFIIASLANIY